MHYETKFIKQIYEATDIVELIGETVVLERQGNYYVGLCPFHKERTVSFTVYPEEQRYHCFGCGVGGNVYSFVMQKDNCSFDAAVSKLAARAGIPMPEKMKDEKTEEKRSRMYQINEFAYSFFFEKGKNNEKAVDYLIRKRGLSSDTIKKFGLGMSCGFGQELYRHLKMLGFTEEEMTESGLIGYGEVYGEHGKKKMDYFDKFWERIMFPILNENGSVVGFGGRILGEGKPKYLNSPESIIFDKSHELYGLHIAKKQGKPYILCEGYIDVISMHQSGFSTAVASLGTSLTAAQAKMIASHAKSVYIAYDSDEPGLLAAARAIPMLEDAGLNVFVVSTAPYKDVDELLRAKEAGPEEMKERIKAAVPGRVFLVRRLDKTKDDYYEKMTDFLV